MTQETEERSLDACTRKVSKDKKLPAMQFYPGDWRRDVGVQSLSFHDRGVWFEMLMLMHGSERRGVLVLNGQAMTDEMIARAIGLDNHTFNQTLATLLRTGVANREDESGAVMNRRMVRDEQVRKVHAACGAKGGNPALLNQSRTNRDKGSETPSSSPSISSSRAKTKTLAQSVPPEELAGTLPLVDGTEYEISPEQIQKWSQAYPAVDVMAELRKLNCWLEANPTRRKTRTGIARAIVNWMSRAQNQPILAGVSNGILNRGQARTDGNIAAAKRAMQAIAGRAAGWTSGGAASGCE